MSDNDEQDKEKDKIIPLFSKSAGKQANKKPAYISFLENTEQDHDKEAFIHAFPKQIDALRKSLQTQKNDVQERYPGQNIFMKSSALYSEIVTSTTLWNKCVKSFRDDLQQNNPAEYEKILNDFVSDAQKENDPNNGFKKALLAKTAQFKTLQELFDKNLPDIKTDFAIEYVNNDKSAVRPLMTLVVSPPAEKDLLDIFQDYLDKRRHHLSVVKKPTEPKP